MPLQDKAKNDIVFQSTLPTRGSDGRRAMEKILRSEISIHAPHEGERPAPPVDINDLAANFNPRSPRGGATWARLQGTIHRRYFNPRSPRGGATKFAQAVATGFYISIHAPHEGERLGAVSTYRRGKAISIHAPHEGERRGLDNIWIRHIHFNPRSPRGGATPPCYSISFYLPISIHAPHEGERRGAWCVRCF